MWDEPHALSPVYIHHGNNRMGLFFNLTPLYKPLFRVMYMDTHASPCHLFDDLILAINSADADTGSFLPFGLEPIDTAIRNRSGTRGPKVGSTAVI